MFTQLLSQPPQPLGKAKEGVLVSPSVEAVVMKGLAKAPTDRYPDVRTFARELRAAVVAPAPEPEKAGMFGRLRGLFKK
jgi:serine/threonine-protein kinase